MKYCNAPFPITQIGLKNIRVGNANIRCLNSKIFDVKFQMKPPKHTPTWFTRQTLRPTYLTVSY